ncbi:MAG: 1-(5-phosphoribosyl)-5-[(5-phosphoribosylamino)methylideneamino]imidazole-4-carboxamide isomerase [Nitrospinaceae bacterium]|nr:1-(5-phosphoribosyl)-5-[(5-phosphoribosylamino)methylideneamino]imidazole-4-carboxamide isomerase [Nitrospinaceae bacterium]NIR53605.1 1-(5-phosphoribosyl)-5-[(5-phosphoribosylamino)methylideneamino]imidazole-4-carboxamide isomerase [Nitrospinaceae bacterium]NIS84008.1 1-(5-phosphoribosyl)-5-[(5-phosphoribosylamino)methylideneamino]imidazole-4-carboxamide isomerase [Nitrospinaceae bacterium]NIT80813.1 1-(5-phosphoribosyl)-5-[(5-phosphoribosylamino)methylideneamino]imidazole-4-carboxamide isom
MKIIPAVDIKEGRCVRLTQGKEDQETVYSDNPLAMAQHWDEQGARLIHVVDLDGAFRGQPKNASLIKDIIYSSTVDIQVGGGIRSMDAITSYVAAGAYRVVLGTIAHQDPTFVKEACQKFPGKIMIGIDAREGKVAVKGWTEVSNQKASDLAKAMEPLGVAGFIFTDISRDGMLEGPNLDSIRRFAQSTSLPVVASGGVSNIEDVSNLLNLQSEGIEGMIIGKALYDKRLDFKEALNRAKAHAG